jgi:putative membrane protein
MMIMMYGDGFGWGWMMLMPLFWIVPLGVIVWAVIKLAQRPADRTTDQPRRETPQEILDRRLASGEIDGDAYRQARELLAGRGPRSS